MIIIIFTATWHNKLKLNVFFFYLFCSRINIGCDFQADIPDIQIRSKLAEDIHKANLLWTPCYLDTPDKNQRGNLN